MALSVMIVAETPEHSFSQNPGQPASTFKGYRVVGNDGETVADVMERVLGANDLGEFAAGTTFSGYDEASAETRVLRTQLATE